MPTTPPSNRPGRRPGGGNTNRNNPPLRGVHSGDTGGNGGNGGWRNQMGGAMGTTQGMVGYSNNTQSAPVNPINYGSNFQQNGGGGRPNKFLTGQQIHDFRTTRDDIMFGATDARAQLGYQEDMAYLMHTQTKDNVLRTLGQTQEDIRRGFNQNREDLERGIGFGLEDLSRGVNRSREDLQRGHGRALEDTERGFGRAEEDLGRRRSRDMTSLIDSLGARGIRGSGVGNRFQGQAADDFDLASDRLGEDRTLQTNRLNDDLAFGMGRLDDDLAFGTNRLNDQLAFGLNRLNDNMNFGLERAQSNSDYAIGQADIQWTTQEGGFEIALTGINNQEQAALNANLGQREVWNAEGAAASVQPGSAGGSGGGNNQRQQIQRIRNNDNLTPAQKKRRIAAIKENN